MKPIYFDQSLFKMCGFLLSITQRLQHTFNQTLFQTNNKLFSNIVTLVGARY